MNRRAFVAGAVSLVAAGADAPRACLMMREEEARRMRDAARKRTALLEMLLERALRTGPWTVTSRRPAGVDAGPNDYYSEGPYWWPDPKNPGGPYMRKDGERNPGRFVANRNDLGSLCETTLTLGMGAYLLGKRECVARAATILSAWFLDPKTRMNPNPSMDRPSAASTPGGAPASSTRCR